MNKFDIAIIGGGLVGIATACALSHIESKSKRLRIAIIDPGLKNTLPLANNSSLLDSFDKPTLRASAINGATQRYFKEIGIWDMLYRSARVQDFLSIEVWEKEGDAFLTAHCQDYGYSSLGCIIENRVMHYCLSQFAIESPQITFFNQTCIDSLFDDEWAFLTLNDKTILHAKLVIGADGAHSWIREHESIPIYEQDYLHHALITTVSTELPHNACARQLFYKNGIVAFLPLYEQNKSCLVWSTLPHHAKQLQMMTEEQFSAELFLLTGDKVGICRLENERLCFPLKARFAKQFVKHRLVLIGDAAHTIHPLAGQGVNLGFQDSALLVATINKLFQADEDFGCHHHLKSFQFTRRKDTLIMMAAMRTIQDMFAGQNRLKKWARAIGMNTINQLSPLKKLIIKYAMD